MKVGWAYPRLFAHRGGGALAPENTLAAMQVGCDQGFHAVEFDVKLSKDGVAMLMHDDTLDRTTNGTGRFKDFTAVELETLDAGLWFGEVFAGTRIPRLEDVLVWLAERGVTANVELKPCAGREAETGDTVAREVAAHADRFRAYPLLSSFSIEALAAAQAVASDLPRGLLVDRYEPTLHDDVLRSLDAVSLHTDHATFDQAAIRSLHARGYRVLLYTVNDAAAAARWWRAGIDGLFTDNLADIRV